jgi:hypothetical protein
MKLVTWLASVPALLVAGMPAANANGILDYLCANHLIPQFLCGNPGGGGGGPVSVSEPEMIALFSTGLIVAAVAAVRRKRTKA